MELNKSKNLSKGYIIFTTLSFVFGLMFIENSIAYIRASKLDIACLPPENLNRALELFRLNLKVESQNFPAEEMIKTKSWGELQSTVSAYAQRLKFIENRDTLRSITVLCLWPFSFIGMYYNKKY